MKNLSFDDGRESFKINGDESRVIRFNPADPEIINRILETQNEFKGYELPKDIELNPDGSVKDEIEKSGAYIAEFSSAIRRAFNDIFNADVYDVIFDGQSPLCIVGEQYLFEAVFDGILKLMKPAIEAYNKKNEEKIGKYTGDIK